MLKVNNLSKSYGKLEVLKGIDFEISRGKVYGFLGKNGAGKTTTMNILTGLIDFNGGEVILDGKDFKKNKRELLKKVGYLPQNPVFYGYMNGFEYLKFIGTITNMPIKEIKKRSEDLLETLGMKEAGKRKISEYSGGMKQRFGMAVAMFNNPEILFLDEPTASLDPEGRSEVLQLINNLKGSGTTIFLSSHILNDIERVCDKVSIIDQGKILVSEGLEVLKNSYIQPVFDLEFQEECSSFRNSVIKYKWVESVKVEKNKISIFVKDIDIARRELLRLSSEELNPLVSFKIRKSNLEDIFLRLVNENGNI